MKHAPGVICRVKPPKWIPKWEYDQTNERIVTLVRPGHTDAGLPAWKIDPKLKVSKKLPFGATFESLILAVAEICLVPIDPGTGDDETLTWAPVPGKVTEKA